MHLCIDMLLKQVLRPWNILPSMHRIELKKTCKTCQKNSANYSVASVFIKFTLPNLSEAIKGLFLAMKQNTRLWKTACCN